MKMWKCMFKWASKAHSEQIGINLEYSERSKKVITSANVKIILNNNKEWREVTKAIADILKLPMGSALIFLPGNMGTGKQLTCLLAVDRNQWCVTNGNTAWIEVRIVFIPHCPPLPHSSDLTPVIVICLHISTRCSKKNDLEQIMRFLWEWNGILRTLTNHCVKIVSKC